MRNINQLTPDNRFQLPEHLRPPMFASIVAEHKDGREQQDGRTYGDG
ncbi:hypothetical protein SAMN05446935_7385 [Burkholderia sp. YR290]|jgi:hypothetical protein|nr:hypothetical protein SAMN05446935_7385 [Burkholderia sp. YR290]